MDSIIFLAALPAFLAIRFFIRYDKDQHLPKAGFRAAVLFGLLSLPIAIGLSTLAYYLLGVDSQKSDIMFINGNMQITNVAGVYFLALSEEIAKFVPLAIFIAKKPYFNNSTDAFTYFAIAGFSFAVPETILYSLSAGGIFVTFMRFAIGLFLHAALTSILGYIYFKNRKQPKAKLYLLMTVLILGAGMIHFLYNFGLYAMQDNTLFIVLSSAMSIGVSIAMFIIYYRSVKENYNLAPANPGVTNPAPLPAQQPQQQAVPQIATPNPPQSNPPVYVQSESIQQIPFIPSVSPDAQQTTGTNHVAPTAKLSE